MQLPMLLTVLAVLLCAVSAKLRASGEYEVEFAQHISKHNLGYIKGKRSGSNSRPGRSRHCFAKSAI